MVKSARKFTVFLLLPVACCLLPVLAPLAQAVTSSTPSTTVSATINPLPEAFSISISAVPPGEVDPGADVTYTVTYSNTGQGNAPEVEIVVLWGFETDQVADYVGGSASQAWGGATPSVDLVNRKIIWTIPTLPANTLDQKVTFRLRTHLTHPYVGTYRFFSEASLLVSGVTVAESDRWTNSVTYAEAYPTGVLPPGLETLSITYVRILEITAHHAKIFWLTNKPSTSEILYGLSKAYGFSISDPTFVKEHVISLDDLTPETLYHFQVVSTTEAEKVESEDYIFKTAKEVEVVPTVDVGSLLVRAFNLRLLPDDKNKIKLYPNVEVEFELPIFGRNLYVSLNLGGRVVPMVSQKEIFSTSTKTPSGLGEHKVSVEVKDKAGNFFYRDLLILVVQRLPKVINFSGKPIERARVTLFRFDPFINRFAVLDLVPFRQENPTFTNKFGEYLFVIPYGRYQLVASAVGFKTYKGPTVVVLQNGIFGEDIVLQAIPVGILERLFYTARHFLEVVFEYTSDLIESLIVARLVEKLAFPLLLLSIISLFLVFLDRFGLTPKLLLSYLRFLFKKLFFIFGKKTVPIWGTTLDSSTGDSLNLVEVKVLSSKNRRCLGTCFTDNRGEFGFILPQETYFLVLTKVGFVVPEWELVKTEQGKAIFGNAILFAWEGTLREKKKIWLKPQEFPGKLSTFANIYAFLKSIFFTLANFFLIAGLVVSLLNLKFNFGTFNLLMVSAYLVLAIFWAILAFRKVKL